MTKVTLHGTDGTRTTTLKEQIEGIHERLAKAKESDKDRSARDRRASFAIVRDLTEPLKRLDATETELWNAIKARFGVESRSELTPKQWAVVAAELDCARNNKHALIRIVRPQYKEGSAENYRIYATDPNTGQVKKIHEAAHTADLEKLESRSQRFADNNGKMVRMVRQDAGYCRIFTPAEIDIPC